MTHVGPRSYGQALARPLASFTQRATAHRIGADDVILLARIVVVDDDPPVRRALARLLVEAGYDVCTCGTATELLAELNRMRADCVLADVHLPDMGGLELHGRLCSLTDPPAVLLITADHDVARTHAIVASGVPCLLKPLDEDVLLQAIAHALGSSRTSLAP
jgi:FixJ family two-component response regulator